MGDVKITSVYMLMEMLILISLYMKTCSIALLLVFPNLVTILHLLVQQESHCGQISRCHQANMRVNPLPFEVLLEVEQCPGQISGEKQLSERNFRPY